MMQQVVLISMTPRVKTPELKVVTSALNAQLARDFGPEWGVDAEVSILEAGAALPLLKRGGAAWPIFIVETQGSDRHGLDQNQRPYAVVQHSPTWIVDVSHELLEMLANPFGDRTIGGQSPKANQGRVSFIAEPCDPVDGGSYVVDGITVSDFCTPKYYYSMAMSGPFDRSGALARPLDIGGDPAQLEWLVAGAPPVRWHKFHSREAGGVLMEPESMGPSAAPIVTHVHHRASRTTTSG